MLTQVNTAQLDYTPRKVEKDGRSYTVVPVVMMVEGVHAGSQGPVLHLQQYFSQNPESWNGKPLTNGHPRNKDGQFVSVDQVDENEWIVGYIDNTYIEDSKLKAEAWIDDQKAVAINPEIINYITEQRTLDVSTGSRTRDKEEKGLHNSEAYQKITTHYDPDHLALLPGSQGACSWSDGCGIRNNTNMKDKNKRPEPINSLQANADGFRELVSLASEKLHKLDNSAASHYVVEMFDDKVIYEEYTENSTRFSSQDYSLSDNGDLEFTGAPTEVRRKVDFVPVQSNQAAKQTATNSCGCDSLKRTKFNNNTKTNTAMSEKNQPTGEVMDKVSALVNNERTRFTKGDRKWLLELNEEQLDKLVPSEPEAQEVSREQALQALQEDFSDIEKVKQLLPEDIRKSVETGITAYHEQRTQLIKRIQANTGDTWTQESLEDMDTDTLERIEKSSRKVDYSGQGSSAITNNQQSDGVAPMLPAGIELES